MISILSHIDHNLNKSIAIATDISLDFSDFPEKTAALFKDKFPTLQKDLEKVDDDTAHLFIIHDPNKKIYKATFILGLDLTIFGVDENRSYRIRKDKLDLSTFAPYFMELDDYIEVVASSSNDIEEKRLIYNMTMSIMLINEKGDVFEFFADTDFYAGAKEVIISPDFIFTKNGSKPFTTHMEPTNNIISQVFILPPAYNEDGKLTPESMIYNFFFFKY